MAPARRRRRQQRAGSAEILITLAMFVGAIIGVGEFTGWYDVGKLIPDVPATEAAPPKGKPAPPGGKPVAPRTPPPGTLACSLEGEEKQQACRDAKAYAYGFVLRKWGGDDWPCADRLWHNESGWNAWAVNPSSDAYGIAQILPAAHGHPAGTELGNWKGQLDWGLRYVEDRYGSPCSALAHWNSQDPHWY